MKATKSKLSRAATLLLLMSIATLTVSLPKPVRADSSFGVDGVGDSISCSVRSYDPSTNTYAGCGAASLTTTRGNDAIIVLVNCTNCGGDLGVVPSVDSVFDQAGLTFMQRYSFAHSNVNNEPLLNANSSLWEYYAIAQTPLTDDNITITFSDATNSVGMRVISVSGVNPSAPFDSGSSFPASTPCDWRSGSCSSSFSTSSPDLVIASVSVNDAPSCNTPSGFTSWGGGWWEVDYQIFSAPQTNYTFSCNSTSTQYTEPVATAVDAIAASSSPHAHPPIVINSDAGFTSDNGVVGGSGTSDDPYQINGWNIQAGNYGIMIANTTAYFTISGVTVNGPQNGIVFSNIENGVLQNSQIAVSNGNAVRVENSNNFQITGNQLGAGLQVIYLYNSDSFDVSFNNLQGGTEAIRGSYVSSASIVGNTGGAEDGVGLDNISGLLISQNSVRAHVSFSVQSCGNLTIDSNTANAFNSGISILDCSNVLVSNNTASNIPKSDGGVGVSIAESTSIDIRSNIVSNDAVGIQLVQYATGNSVTGDTISNNTCGIQTDTTTVGQNYIADNTFQNNVQDICNP